jgi:hypothetical protein
MKPGPCQVRSRTQSPCLHQAVVEILGIPFCEACAREQEVYFAIGELTQGEDKRDLRIEPLTNYLKRDRRCWRRYHSKMQATLISPR